MNRSDVLGQFMPLVGVDWSQSGVAHLFSAIKVCPSKYPCVNECLTPTEYCSSLASLGYRLGFYQVCLTEMSSLQYGTFGNK